MNTPFERIQAERKRLIEIYGLTPERADQYRNDELILAATAFLFHGTESALLFPGRDTPVNWPWDPCSWKPGPRDENLVRAGALLLAEHERLDRGGAKCWSPDLPEELMQMVLRGLKSLEVVAVT